MVGLNLCPTLVLTVVLNKTTEHHRDGHVACALSCKYNYQNFYFSKKKSDAMFTAIHILQPDILFSSPSVSLFVFRCPPLPFRALLAFTPVVMNFLCVFIQCTTLIRHCTFKLGNYITFSCFRMEHLVDTCCEDIALITDVLDTVLCIGRIQTGYPG
jgi:hypothetical protein